MRKPIKIICFVLCLSLGMVLIFGCGQSSAPEESNAGSDAKTPVRIAVLKGPTGMGMAWLMEQMEQGQTSNEYTFTIEGAPDAVTSKLVTGELDMAGIPTNMAALLYQKTSGEIQVLVVNTLGVLYIVEKGNEVTDLSQLEGKTLVSAGQGTTAEYVLSYVLEQNGLTPGKNLTVDYVTEHSEAVTLTKTGKYDYAVLPEPFVTSLLSAEDSFRIVADLTEEWNQTGAGLLSMGAIAVRKDFAENHPEAIANFLKEYEQSVSFTNENIEESARLIEKYDIMPMNIALKAIPNAHIVFATGEEMKTSLNNFYQILFAANPKSIGGQIPDDNFYLMP
ncbi:MAG: ABC transporter substrate-binding protein [Dehalobacterium sp.]|jgi:NitT/TauT family transport system substrate-binding protein